MDEISRYAVYYCPRPGSFADRAAAWMGWDVANSTPVPHADIAGLPALLPEITADARKYGFHGTLRAPFRPAVGLTRQILAAQVSDMAQRLPAVHCDGLQMENLDGFLALTPTGGDIALQNLAAAVVEGTNDFRAPLSAADIARRRPESLTPRQRALLDVFGYPYVMELFQFHLTLTGRLPADQTDTVAQAAMAFLHPVLPAPFVIADLCLMGEDSTGRFHLLSRHALTG